MNIDNSVVMAFTVEQAEKLTGIREALKARDFATADAIREELAAQRLQMKDGKDPETGERVTTWEAI